MASQTDWDPLKELLAVQKRMNDLFESALARTIFETTDGFDSWTPLGDVYETPEALVICLELPGLPLERIDLRIDGDELVVEGEREVEREQAGERHHRMERSYGRFSRRFNLPSNVDRDAIEASYRDGTLQVRLPNRGREQPKPVKVAIS